MSDVVLDAVLTLIAARGPAFLGKNRLSLAVEALTENTAIHSTRVAQERSISWLPRLRRLKEVARRIDHLERR